jgi:hypothetical protein
LENEHTDNINDLPGFQNNIFSDLKYRKTNKRSVAGRNFILKSMLKNIPENDYDTGISKNIKNIDGFDKKLTLIDLDVKKKKLNSFLGNSQKIYKEVGGYKDSVFFKLWNSILKKININIWAPDLLPNYRKRQLNLGFNYIPEHLVFKNYKNLNHNTYMKKRLDNYYYKNRDILEKFDLSYPITGQLKENRLNLIDKHIWGYPLNKVKKLDENEFFNLNNNFNNSFRFDNEIYINSKNSFSGIVPFYFTNRTHSLMTNINKYSGSSKFTISDIIHSNSPGVYKILGYHNIRNMGINKNFDSRFKINKNIPNFDILKISLFYLKKKKSYNSLLSNFNNQVKNSFVNNSTIHLFLIKLKNITKIKNKNNIFSIV